MKKFISLALAAAMTLSLVPVSAFASTDNRVSNVVTVEKDDILTTTNAPKIVIKNDKGDIKERETVEFELVLDGAEWDSAAVAVTGNLFAEEAKVTKISSTRLLVKATALGDGTENGEVKDKEAELQLIGAKITGDKATVTIDPKQSTVSADTFTFAKAVDGSTITTIDGTTDIRDEGKIKDIIIEETTAGTFEKNGTITLKLNSGFKFKEGVEIEAGVISGTTGLIASKERVDDRTVEIKLADKQSTEASMIRVKGLTIVEDGADFGDVAEITVSGAGTDKTTLEVATLVDYGVGVSVEDKDLPVIYSGSLSDGDDNETLKVTLKENATESWLTNRKTTFTFPEGVKVNGVEFVSKDSENVTKGDVTINSDKDEVSVINASVTRGEKAEYVVKFDLNVAPDFTGDIKCTVGGAALPEDTEVTVAKAVAPVIVEAEKTSVAIDYRNVAVGDITVKEAEAGLWGKDEKIVLEVENMTFESGMKAEIVEGDGEIKKLDVKDGRITITVDSESSKTPMAIKLTDCSLYLGRSLPAGDYALSLVYGANTKEGKIIDVMFENYDKDATGVKFDVDEVEVLGDYVTVATAGRDQGTTFTTNVVVTIDSTTMLVDGKEVTLDVPAYLSAEGWTMLPVRAVTEALATSSNSEPIDWIAGNPGTIMIYYGDKTVSMTLGSTTMYINGTPVPMSTAPVIVNDRAFLPMRDLGRALGLSDSQIAWDATARTATFNPVAE